jgi:hypothetical protein
MSLTGKLDLDGLLKDWPAPSTRDDAAWDERADLIVEAAVARRAEDKGALGALLDAPPLAPEPGEPADAEPRPAPAAAKTHLRALPGGEERTMSQGSDQDGGRKSAASVAPERKRQSLKEIAARASQTGLSASPPSRTSAVSTPLPPATATPLPSRPGSTPPVRPSEAGKEDSGIVDLKIVNATATPQQKAAAAKAQPGTAELGFDEDNKGGDASPPSIEAKTERRPATLPAAPQQKKGSGGLIAGAAIAIIGLAASFAIMKTRTPAQEPRATQEAPAAAPEQPQQQPEQAAPQPTAAATEQPATEQAAGDTPKPAEEGKVAMGGPVGTGAAAPASPSAAPTAEAPVAQGGKVPAPASTGKPGDLSAEMQKAVGSEGNKSGVTEAPEPAAGKPLNQTVPEQPPQGSVQAAIGSVMGGAKACVSGADDVSRAQVTFSSSGSVSNVSVTGWAASNGASTCIKSALKGANVGAFSKPSYTVGVTIRP